MEAPFRLQVTAVKPENADQARFLEELLNRPEVLGSLLVCAADRGLAGDALADAERTAAARHWTGIAALLRREPAP